MGPKKTFPIFEDSLKRKASQGTNTAETKKAKKTKIDSHTLSPSIAKVPSSQPDAPHSRSLTDTLMSQLSDPKWHDILKGEVNSDYFKKICAQIEADKALGKTIFPPEEQIFATFTHTPFESIKAVIIGQDPYHDDHQAHGLCFSVNKGVTVPPSLKNMYAELEKDISGFKTPPHGNLESWAKQGVLLLNATLTVEAHKANSHASYGWQTFTDNVIKHVSSHLAGVVFLLWGGFAQKKAKLIDASKHHVIQAAHPSPLSVTKWRGCKVFSQTNTYLLHNQKDPINWQN